MPQSIHNPSLCKEVHSFSYGTFFFFQDIIVAEINEGTTLDYDECGELLRAVDAFYGDRCFGYLSHRTHSYAVDPTGYKKLTNDFPNMIAFAVVNNKTISFKPLAVEKRFMSLPFEAFNDLDTAFSWLDHLIQLKCRESA